MGRMNRSRRGGAVFLLGALFSVGGVRLLRAEDSGYWQFFTLRYLAAPRLELDAYPELIYDHEGTQMSYLLLHSAALAHLHPHVDVGFDYAYVRARNAQNLFVTQHWMAPQLFLKGRLGPVPVVWRNQMEIREGSGVSDRERSKVTVNSPRSFTPLGIKLFASYEVFYDFHRMAENQTRATAGISLPVDKRVEMSLFYLRQGLLGEAAWKFVNYIGSDLRFAFGPGR